MSSLFDISITGVLTATIRMAVPLVLASLGGVFTARVGIINLALEGMMLFGAFSGFIGAVYSGSAIIGAVCGMAGGALAALILAFLSITAKANQTVAGVGINITALGITSYLLSTLFGYGNRPYGVASFSNIAIPVLSDIPVIGPVLFDHSLLVYVTYIAVPAVWYLIYRTPAGLTIRATGENPRAVDTLGGNVMRTRYLCTLASGVLAGLAGAYLTIGQMGQFMENVTAGKGYIAVAALIFGKWKPLGAVAASLLFGFAEGLQLRLQIGESPIPFQFLSMLPYVMTMVALLLFVGRAKAPAAMGKPYNRQD
ncbi:MAG: ABC transporter permease [Sphaerochaetaceae bacterium]|nr:ABC transporter permease [Sphaerochaetaceae bacterium]